MNNITASAHLRATHHLRFFFISTFIIPTGTYTDWWCWLFVHSMQTNDLGLACNLAESLTDKTLRNARAGDRDGGGLGGIRTGDVLLLSLLVSSFQFSLNMVPYISERPILAQQSPRDCPRSATLTLVWLNTDRSRLWRVRRWALGPHSSYILIGYQIIADISP